MDLESAINLLKNTVKYTGTIDQKHIDLTLVSADQRDQYEKALVVSQKSVKDGVITRDELFRRLKLD